MQILNCESSGKQEQDYDYNMNKKRSLCDLTGLLALAILIFYKKFSGIVNLDFESFICRNPGLRKFFKNLRKIDFSILVYLDDSENLESFELYLFFEKNIV